MSEMAYVGKDRGPLRHGRTYEARVRMVRLDGGELWPEVVADVPAVRDESYRPEGFVPAEPEEYDTVEAMYPSFDALFREWVGK